MIHSVLMVCTANICRSPMAAALLAAGTEGAALRVESAGINALVGLGADPDVRELLAEDGIDLSGHWARQLDINLAREFELILAMESAQVDWLKQTYPQLWGRIFRLGHWNGEDIADPFGMSRRDLENAKALIERNLEEWKRRAIRA